MPSAAEVTILIPHYQTPDAIRLCLRSIRRYTAEPCRVLVLDNGSTDGSLDYLRSVRWIDVVPTGVPNDVIAAHAAALNFGAARVETPYFLIMHSDTYVHRPGWLALLVDTLRSGRYAAVGARHQHIRAYDSALLARATGLSARLISRLAPREVTRGVPWLRSCLALYRTDRFRAAACDFTTNGRQDVTHAATLRLVAAGERVLALPDRVLGYYVYHKGDTTRIANRLYPLDATFHARVDRHCRHVAGFQRRQEIQAILCDASLDR